MCVCSTMEVLLLSQGVHSGNTTCMLFIVVAWERIVKIVGNLLIHTDNLYIYTGSPNGLQIHPTENNNICFNAYSTPDYPIWYTVNVTGKIFNNTIPRLLASNRDYISVLLLGECL